MFCTRLPKPKVQNYLLLEVLVSFVLLVSCLFPLLHTHLFLHQRESYWGIKAELARIEQILLSEIKIQIIEEKVSWQDSWTADYDADEIQEESYWESFSNNGSSLLDWITVDNTDLQVSNLQALYSLQVCPGTKGRSGKDGRYYLLDVRIVIVSQEDQEVWGRYKHTILVRRPKGAIET